MVVVAVEAAAATTMTTRFSVFNLLPQMKTRRIIPLSSSSSKDLPRASAGLPNKSFNPVLLPNTSPPQQKQHSTTIQTTLSAAASLTLPFFLNPPESLAGGGEFGVLEGRSFALVHPIVMSGLFLYTLYAGYLGWQWRRVRTLQDEINELKKQILPAQQLVTVPDDATATRSSPPSAVETKIQGLTEERKNLIKGSFRDRHFNAGSLLLGFGVLEAVGGCLNTWLRTGKLFPGPHLFAGAGITVLWAAAAALVPAMQKGDETARSLHIALNTVNVLLFIWQIPTGFDIVLKVFEFTKWP